MITKTTAQIMMTMYKYHFLKLNIYKNQKSSIYCVTHLLCDFSTVIELGNYLCGYIVYKNVFKITFPSFQGFFFQWNGSVRSASLSATKGKLLKRYRLQHATFGGGHSQPCFYSNCLSAFKTQSALRTHLSRYHAAKDQSPEPNTINTFKCLVCDESCCSERDFFQHIGHHLKSHESVVCVFEDCNFQTITYNTFLKHKSRTHKLYSLSDFKQALYETL